MNTRQILEALHEDIVVEAMSSNIWQEKKHARVTIQTIIDELEEVQERDMYQKGEYIENRINALKQLIEP